MVFSRIGVKLGLPVSPVPLLTALTTLTPELLSDNCAEEEEGLSDPGGRLEAEESGPPIPLIPAPLGDSFPALMTPLRQSTSSMDVGASGPHSGVVDPSS